MLSFMMPGFKAEVPQVLSVVCNKDYHDKQQLNFRSFGSTNYMLAVTCYSIFLKSYEASGLKGYELI